MKVAYVDTSCLAAIAFDEPQAESTTRLMESFDRLISSNLLEAELRSALVREQVEGSADPLLSRITWILPDRPLQRELLESLTQGYVRGADLWHLACALFLKHKVPGLAFLTLDERQREIAAALGFATR